MIRAVSRNVQCAGATSPFKHHADACAFTIQPSFHPNYHHSNQSHHRTRTRKQQQSTIMKCNGQLDLQQTSIANHDVLNNSKQANNHNIHTRIHNQKTRSSPQHHKSNGNNNNNSYRTSPLKEIQSNVTKVSDCSDHSDTETSLFAGSKSYVTPSPSELPKPPKNWMCNSAFVVLKSSPSSLQDQNTQKTVDMIKKKSDKKVDFMDSDSAVLVVGSNNVLLSKSSSKTKKKN